LADEVDSAGEPTAQDESYRYYDKRLRQFRADHSRARFIAATDCGG
jgi:hypothetical protein